MLGEDAGEAPIGSNGWAVAGQRTRDGRAILANDMHLELGVPNVWYRAELRYGEREVAGVVLPGVPVVIVGTNRHVAWGLTSLLGDVMDLVRLETLPERPGEYRTPSGWKRFDVAQATIKVRGEPDASVTVRRTIWGLPRRGRSSERRSRSAGRRSIPRASTWDPRDGFRVRSVDDAVAVMSAAGGPGCNVLLADGDGRVAWTVTGRMPRRRGFDGSVSVSWADGRAGWDGYLAPAALPRIVDPPSGFVVNANHRMPLAEGAPVLAHDYANGYRAYRITERLREARPATEADLFQLPARYAGRVLRLLPRPRAARAHRRGRVEAAGARRGAARGGRVGRPGGRVRRRAAAPGGVPARPDRRRVRRVARREARRRARPPSSRCPTSTRPSSASSTCVPPIWCRRRRAAGTRSSSRRWRRP